MKNRIKEPQVGDLQTQITTLNSSASALSFIRNTGGIVSGELIITGDVSASKIGYLNRIDYSVPRLTIGKTTGSGELNIYSTERASLILNGNSDGGNGFSYSQLLLKDGNNESALTINSLSGTPTAGYGDGEFIVSGSGLAVTAGSSTIQIVNTGVCFNSFIFTGTSVDSKWDELSLFVNGQSGVLDTISGARRGVFLNSYYLSASTEDHLYKSAMVLRFDLASALNGTGLSMRSEYHTYTGTFRPLEITAQAINPIIEVLIKNNSFNNWRIEGVVERTKIDFSSSSSSISSSSKSSSSRSSASSASSSPNSSSLSSVSSASSSASSVSSASSASSASSSLSSSDSPS